MRSKGRNILIGIIVLVIATASCVALTIKNSASEVVTNQQENSTVTATIGVDRQAIMQKAQSGSTDMRSLMNSVPALTLDQLKSYANSKYVKSFTYQETASLDSSNITATSNTSSTSSSSSSSNQSNNGRNDMPDHTDGGQSKGDFKLVGYSSTKAMSDFVSGTYKITSGSMFSDSDTGYDCVITNELAQQNSLKVGSQITFTNPSDTTQSYTFTVVGIYKDTSSSDGSQMDLFSNASNQIITNYTAVNNIVSKSASNSSTALTSQLSSSFTLTNSNVVNKFTSEVKSKGLNQYYSVTTNADTITEELQPINNLNSFATTFLILVLIIGGIILIVLNMFNIRERKYEVGVLRAIGMKKGKVALQFITELFIVTFAALIIGTAVGGFASVPVANHLLKNQISSSQSEQSQVNQNFGRPSGGTAQSNGTGTARASGGNLNGYFGLSKNVSYINQINAVINGKVLLEIAGIGILLTILSSGMSMIVISRYEPLKILSSRS